MSILLQGSGGPDKDLVVLDDAQSMGCGANSCVMSKADASIRIRTAGTKGKFGNLQGKHHLQPCFLLRIPLVSALRTAIS